MVDSMITTVGAVVILGMLVVLVAFHLIRGRIRIDAGPSQSRIQRFNAVERFAHWITAASFILLALTGIDRVWGETLLLPLFGHDAFTTLTAASQIVHTNVSFAFMFGVLMMIVLWLGHNFPAFVDLKWLKAAGGLFVSGVHPPSLKFNAGQKGIFWVVVLGGSALAGSGLILLFPAFAASIADPQTAMTVHLIVGPALAAIMVAHIYIGTLGMEGAFEAMYSGEVDINWAKEHHDRWVAQVTGQPLPSKGAVRPQGGGD